MQHQLIDYDFFMLLGVIFNLIITIFGGIYMFFKDRDKASNTAIAEVHEKLDSKSDESKARHHELRERVAKLEERPTYRQDIIDIHNRMNKVSEDLAKVEGNVEKTSSQVDRIADFLMNQGGKQ